jgi:hypothetical protein
VSLIDDSFCRVVRVQHGFQVNRAATLPKTWSGRMCASLRGGEPGMSMSSRSAHAVGQQERSLRELFEMGGPVSSEELLSKQWVGVVPFPGQGDRGTPYRTAQLVMAIMAKASGWSGKSFRRSRGDQEIIDVQALEMKLAGINFSLGILGRAQLLQVFCMSYSQTPTLCYVHVHVRVVPVTCNRCRNPTACRERMELQMER